MTRIMRQEELAAAAAPEVIRCLEVEVRRLRAELAQAAPIATAAVQLDLVLRRAERANTPAARAALRAQAMEAHRALRAAIVKVAAQGGS